MSNSTEKNKALALEAMAALYQRKDASAVKRLYAPSFIDHNPMTPRGLDAQEQFVSQLPASFTYEPGLVVAEGNLVAIHGRVSGWGPTPKVLVDIFRVENGLLAEHWDVQQDEVAADKTVSGLPMFTSVKSA